MQIFTFLTLLMMSFSLFGQTKVLVLAGSTRTDSYNKKLAREAALIAQKMGAKVTVIDLQDYPMPFYDADVEASVGMPEHAKRFRNAMIDSDAILIASPEYNQSMSAVLKNALDWASRGEDGSSSKEAFQGKTFGIMSASPGKKGGARGLLHLQAVIEDVRGKVIAKQVSIPRAYQEFDEAGALVNPAFKQELQEEIKTVLQSTEIP